MRFRNLAVLVFSALLLSGCALWGQQYNSKLSCGPRGGHWTNYDAIGQQTIGYYCKGARESHKAHCDRLRKQAKEPDGNWIIPSYCD